MRENRLYGSEGGEVKSLPYPYHLPRRWSADEFQGPAAGGRGAAQSVGGRPRNRGLLRFANKKQTG